MDPITVLAELAIIIFRTRKKFADCGQLPQIVAEFIENLESCEALLNHIRGQYDTTIVDDSTKKTVLTSLNNLEIAILRGVTALNECSYADPPSVPDKNNQQKRKVKWAAKLFNKDTEKILGLAKTEIRDAMNRLAVAGIFDIRKDVDTLAQKVAALPQEIVEALGDEFLEKLKEEVSSKEKEETVAQKIESCISIEDFVNVYNSTVFQDSLKRLQKSQGSQAPEEWAKEWAIRLRTEGSEADEVLNTDRKVCLSLLYKLCDKWKDDINASVTDDSLIRVFKARRIHTILSYCLVLDRAQALYKMKYPGSVSFGMHWVAKQHTEQMPEMWETKLEKAGGGRPTMNKRFLWLLEFSELGLQGIDPIFRWLQPKCCDVDNGEDSFADSVGEQEEKLEKQNRKPLDP